MKALRILLFLFSCSLLILMSSGTMDSQDGFQYLAIARNMYYLHRPTAPPPEYPQKNVYMNVTKAADGSYYSPTGAGYSIAMLPAVAASDLLHRIYHVSPPEHFPLETDWSVLLFASFTNAFFGALLVVILFEYLKLLGVSQKASLLGSLGILFTTNLLPIAKESFAHMMFITFLVGSFYFVKRFSISKKHRDIALASASFGIMISSYNPIFVLAVLPLAIYYVVLSNPRFSVEWIKEQLKPVLIGVFAGLPFVAFYFYYNAIRTGTGINSGYGLPAASNFKANAHILYEGMFGQLFSPGRGFFLYSPVLLLVLIFWHKIKALKYKAELIAWGLLSAFYLYFFAIQNGGPDWYQWNGESSWGPRYIALLIPFMGMLAVLISTKLSTWQRRLVLYPLIALSVFVQSMGVLIPYQIKFHDLQPEFRLNGVRMTTADYANFIPRYSPLVNMPRELAKRFIEFPTTIEHGQYDVRLYDGFDFPFKLGNREQWRGIHEIAYFSAKGSSKAPLKSIKIGFSNTRLDPQSSYSAVLALKQDGKMIASGSAEADKWGELQTNLPDLNGKQDFTIESMFIGTASAKQVIFIRSMDINDKPISLKALDLPYVQPLAQAMTRTTYKYFGKVETNPWFFWNFHSQMYEGTFDLWWVKPLYYWDLPGGLFASLFTISVIALLISGYRLTTYYTFLEEKKGDLSTPKPKAKHKMKSARKKRNKV